MRDIVVNLKFEDFNKLISTSKIELANGYIYEGILRLFNIGELYRKLAGYIMRNEKFANIKFVVNDLTDEENLSLSYSFDEIYNALKKTNYKIGVSSGNKPVLKKYFSTLGKDIEKGKEKSIDNNLEWISELKGKINSDLLDYLSNMVPNVINNEKLDNFEKLLYLYFAMCNYFSYSEDFFVNREKNEEYRLDYKNIENLSFENRNIVCYEFNVIFALLAEKFGFKTTICDFNENPLVGIQINDIEDYESYKNKHYSVIMDNGVYKVLFDSTRGSLDIDLFNVKVGRNINGIRNVNSVSDNLLQFKIDKVYNMFLEQNNISKSDDFLPIIDIEKQAFLISRVVNRIQDGETYLESISISEKIDIFSSLPLTSDLKGMDLVSYLYVYFKKIFKNSNDVHFRIIRTNEENSQEQKPIVVISYVVDKMRKNFFYDINQGFYYVDNDTIIDNYQKGLYDLVDNDYNLGEFSRRG